MIVYIDIETVPQFKDLTGASKEYQLQWAKFASKRFSAELAQYDYQGKAALYAEWGKVACVSIGFWNPKNPNEFRKQSFCYENEAQILRELSLRSEDTLCGHNIKEFDVPFLARRMLINDMADEVPAQLRVADKKPWDVQLIDTMDLWGMTQWRHNISLELACFVLGIESPKTDMDGSKVAECYWNGEFDKIASYCENDIYAEAQLHRKIIRGLL